jgi:hypothetical protein
MNYIDLNHSIKSAFAWQENPSRLCSLWESMNNFSAHAIYDCLLRLKNFQEKIILKEQNTETGNKSVEIDLLIEIISTLRELQKQCEETNLDCSIQLLNQINSLILMVPTYSALKTALFSIELAIPESLRSRKFIWIDRNFTNYIDNEKLLGDETFNEFPEARSDIRDAGNCLAVDCYTAAVFHLMRIVEWGLRAFCLNLGFKKVAYNKKSGKTKFIPIEYAEWERILNQLPEAIEKKISKIPRGTKRQNLQEYYYGTYQDIKAIKEAWRNHVMHARREYNREEAMGIFNHIENLMERISNQAKKGT